MYYTISFLSTGFSSEQTPWQPNPATDPVLIYVD